MFCFGAAASTQVNQPIGQTLIQTASLVIGDHLQQHKRLQLHLLLERCSAQQVSWQPDCYSPPKCQGHLGEDLQE